jgi:predicted membrane-bound spermidine synthase
MKRATVAAFFSVAFCTISVALYYAVTFSLMAHRFSLRGFIGSLAAAGITAFSVAGPFSFCLGFLGGWILPKLPFVANRAMFISAAILLGGLFGCIFPALFARGDGEANLSFTWLPALITGTSCAGLWAWHWSRRAHGNSTSGDSASRGDG